MKQFYITDVLVTNSDIIRHTFDIPSTIYKNGDYLHKVYLKITLPAIYSSFERQFRWNKYIGYNIIDKVICNIKLKGIYNNQDVQIRLFTYTEWLYIWYEINLSKEEKINHYKSIGHIPELYDPANSEKIMVYIQFLIKKQTYKWIIDNDNNQKANLLLY